MVKAKKRSGDSRNAPNKQRPGWSRVGRWVLTLLPLAMIAGSCVWVVETLRDPRVLPFKVVRIDGQFRHLDRLQIEKVVGREIKGNFFTIDVERVHRAARNLPWVDQVSVRRVWPQTLVMKISEQVPLARWGKNELVNPHGDVFSPLKREIPEGLPYLHGPDGSSHELVERYLNLKPRLALLGLELDQLSKDTRRSWKLVFKNGMRVHLGSKEMETRLQRFISIFPRIQGEAEPGSRLLDVDLRYTNGFTVRRQQKPKTADPDDLGPVTGMRFARAGGFV